MRLENTWHEIIPSSKITPDPLDSQLRVGASSLQFTSLIFYRVRSEDWNDHSKSLVLCSVTHFCVVFEVCVWNLLWFENPNMAHYKISNRVSRLLIFYLMVLDRIYDRAVVKSTFVESKTSPSPKRFESESSPSPKRFESESSPSPKRFESKSKSKWDGQNRQRKKSSSKPHT